MAGFERDGIGFHSLDVGQGTFFVFQHGIGGDVRQAAGLCMCSRAEGGTCSEAS
jgi:hypothetical protein